MSIKHREPFKNKNKKSNNFIPINSIFLTEGKIQINSNVGTMNDDPLFSLNNFDFEKNPITNKIISCGCGSYGEVYLSKNISDNKFYAIKHIKKKQVFSMNQKIDIIYREISIHKTLIHPNIIRLYSFKEDPKSFFLIMEYAKNGNLFQKIRKNKRLSEKLSFHYFIQTVNAIYFLHSNEYAHRDIKPENILIDENNNVKLCDFGWCVDVSGGERGTFCGTYEYMAPEIVKEKPYDKSIDVWSLGILLYEMLHGYSPFRARDDQDNYKEIFKNIEKKKVEFDEKLDISEECKEVIGLLLEGDEKKRIKVGDIFKTKWVKKFEEKEIEKEKKKIMNRCENNDNNNNINNNNNNNNNNSNINNNNININDNINNNNKNNNNNNKNNSNEFSLFNYTMNKHNNNNNNNNNKNKIIKNKTYSTKNTNNILLNDDDKLFIDQETPTPYYQEKNKIEEERLTNSISILERASDLNRINIKNDKKISDNNLNKNKNHKEESFWEKLLRPFKCGD
jgi:serine/threonine protein kinase